MSYTLRLVTLIAASFFGGAALAQTAPAAKPAAVAAPSKADPRDAIVRKVGVKLEDVRLSPVNGVYEVTDGANISYVTADAKYAILGDLLEIDTNANVSEARRRSEERRVGKESSSGWSP